MVISVVSASATSRSGIGERDQWPCNCKQRNFKQGEKRDKFESPVIRSSRPMSIFRTQRWWLGAEQSISVVLHPSSISFSKKVAESLLTFFSYVLLREHLGRRLTYLFLDICQPPSPKRVVFCWYHLLNIYVYGFADGKNYFGSRRDTQKSAKLASDSPQNCLAKIRRFSSRNTKEMNS